MSTDTRCPNCFEPVKQHPENGCVLAALIGVIRDRGEVEEGDLIELHAECNVDALWDRLGQIIDDLQEGHFTDEDEET